MLPETVDQALPSLTYRTAGLASRKPTRFAFSPDAAQCRVIAAALDLIELPKLHFKGEIVPQGRHDYQLRATLTALVVQPCSISLAPVTTPISETVERRYLKDFAEPKAEEMELSEGLDAEPMPDEIDVAAVAIESLLLALPLFPRAAGAALAQSSVAPPGAAPLGDAVTKPFAGLASLAERMKTPDKEPD